MKTCALQGAQKTRPESSGLDAIRVGVKDREYDILVGYDWLDSFGEKIRSVCKRDEAMVFTSPAIGRLYYERVDASLKKGGFTRTLRHDIPDGETNKNLDQYCKAVAALCRGFPHPGRTPVVVTLGGGVVGDLGGFVASTFHRGVGVPFVNLPTTILACVDCGIGGKTGVNFDKVKNMIGTIAQPSLVLADLSLLQTLSRRERQSGVAEVIKSAAIASATLFGALESRMDDLMDLDRQLVKNVVLECYGIKARVVEADEFDSKNHRVMLNFGHTIGHAIETVADYALTHGEAISLGMLAVAEMAIALGVSNETARDRLRNVLAKAGLPVHARDRNMNLDVEAVLLTMQHDKKFVQGGNRFVLVPEVGKWLVARDVDQKHIRRAVESVVR